MPRICISRFAAITLITAAATLIPAAAQSAPPAGPAKQADPAGSTPTQRLHAAVNAKRLPLLEDLLPKLVPQCPTDATRQDVRDYIKLWRKKTGEPAGSPQDIEAAKVQIHIWKMYHCIATYYDGHRYIATPEITGGAPDMGWLEPAEGLSQFFHTAKDKGLLKFDTDKENEYFFERYDNPHYSNMFDTQKAYKWFHTPPWSQGGSQTK